jgi:mono/diheme cytochrome c family protein
MTRSPRIIASVIAGILIVGAVAAFALVWRPAIAAIEPPPPQSFDSALVKRGRDLAAIGNCNDCHTVRGGKAFAGGQKPRSVAPCGRASIETGSIFTRHFPTITSPT